MTAPAGGEQPLGLIAGRGQYPHLLIEQLLASRTPVALAALAGQFGGPVDDCLAQAVFPLGALGAIARFFRRNWVQTCLMAGGVDRTEAWRYFAPDRHGLSLLPQALWRGDDELLRRVADKLERLGVTVADPAPYLARFFAPRGQLAGPRPSEAVLGELDLAWRAARELGSEDAGQAAVVFQGKVVRREGRAGTDAMLACAPGPGAVLAKVVKPGQDRRFDLPAIGPATVLIGAAVGLRAIAIEAHGVLLLQRQRLVELCDQRGISLVGVRGDTIGQAENSLP